MTAGYRIVDEPTPGPLSRLACKPFWPFLALCLVGPWAGYTWFVINAVAFGSPTRVRETVWVSVGLLAQVAIILGFGWAVQQGMVDPERGRYVLVLLLVTRALIGYRVMLLQFRTFELHEHFGGAARNGLPALLILLLIDILVLPALLPDGLRLLIG